MYKLVEKCYDGTYETVKTFTKVSEAFQYAETELRPGTYLLIPEYGATGMTAAFSVLQRGVLDRAEGL